MFESFNSIGIIGYGRFGRLLAEILRIHAPHATLRTLSRSNAIDRQLFFSAEEVYRSNLVIPCVPISVFKKTVEDMLPFLSEGQTVLDVCSVKMHPVEVMLELLPPKVNAVASHPMFGPASFRKLGGDLREAVVVVESVRCDDSIYEHIKESFAQLGLSVIEMESSEHDRLAARAQFVPLVNAMLLKSMQLRRTQIDTRSTDAMLRFLEMISVDRQLVRDLYNYNDFCRSEFARFSKTFEELSGYLLDHRLSDADNATGEEDS